MKYKVNKVFIAGGTGFLGYYTALEFLKRGNIVETIALPNEINLKGWYPKDIKVTYGDLFKMSNAKITSMLVNGGYDTFIYALGPDDRVVPQAPAYEFFYDKLVNQCTRICSCAKHANIRRCVVMGSYFSYFDRKYKGRLSKHHPYIKARVEQEKQLLKLGKKNKFDVMIAELPYIFGTMPERQPLWKDHFLARFDGYKNFYFPCGGGTTAIDVTGVAEGIVACAYSGENGGLYPIAGTNMTYKKLINTMIEGAKLNKKYVGIPAFLCSTFAHKIQKEDKKQGLENGLNIPKLMNGILNKKFYIDPTPYRQALHYEKFGFTGGKNIYDSIKETMAHCYIQKK